MLGLFTIRDVLWTVLVSGIALSWQLDAQVKELEVSDEQDNAAIFRADNEFLERQNSCIHERIQQLEARVATKNATHLEAASLIH